MNAVNIAVAIGALILGAGAGAGLTAYSQAPAIVCVSSQEEWTPTMRHFIAPSEPIPTTGSKGF
jgi:hypothetical protein